MLLFDFFFGRIFKCIGGAIALPLALGLLVLSLNIFYFINLHFGVGLQNVMGKALLGDLSFRQTGIVCFAG